MDAGKWFLGTLRFREATDTSVLLEDGQANLNHVFYFKPAVRP